MTRPRNSGTRRPGTTNAPTWRCRLTLSFHLIEDDVFHDYMRKLFFSAERYVIVYSSNCERDHPAAHVKHRRFTDWVDIYHADFKLVRHVPNRWPLVDDDLSQSFADFFIFERQRTRKHTLPGHLVVSLTSYPRRFPTLELTLRRILQQSVQPDETVLWVSPEDRQHLPEGVLALQHSGLTIRETRDIRSYKKIIPALEHYPDSFVITLDDDTAYPLDTIEPLIANYRSPSEILCRRAHRVMFDESGCPKPYNQWKWETSHESGWDLVATGGAGSLYPPHSLAREVLDEATFTVLAPFADDIWLFWMEHLAGSTVRRVGPRYALQPWPGCNEQGLWVNYNANDGNDRVIAALTARYGSPFEHGPVSGPTREREGTDCLRGAVRVLRLVRTVGGPNELTCRYEPFNPSCLSNSPPRPSAILSGYWSRIWGLQPLVELLIAPTVESVQAFEAEERVPPNSNTMSS